MENRTQAEQCQAIIEDVFLLKDGNIVAGCNLTSGTIREGDRLYYVDCIGRECFPVTIAGLALPQKGGISSLTAVEGQANRVACRLEGCKIEKLHPGHILQSNSEEILYEQAPGWDAITAAFERRYPAQKHPMHFGTYSCFRQGEAGPLDGISIYNGGEYLHFVTYGLSELYEKQNGNPNRSGYGFELTVKLKKAGLVNPMLEVRHMCCVLQMVAGITADNGHQFLPGQVMPISRQRGMDATGKSALSGFITKEDEIGTLDTPFGKVQLIQLVGVTADEIEKLKNKTIAVSQLAEQLKDGLTDFARK